MPHTISSHAYEVTRLGYLVQKTGWTLDEIWDAPAGAIDDLMTYLNEYTAEQNRLDQEAAKK